MSTVVVLAAHPDDELLGIGGTLAKHARAGDEVHAVILAEGATSRYDADMVDVLADAAKRAADVLGLASVRNCSLPDQRLDALPLVDVTQTIERVLGELQPETVYTHFPGDVNCDHGVVGRAAWTACRPYAAPLLRRFAVFETPSSTEWAWPTSDAAFTPGLFVDISDTLDTKLRAMACYASELRTYPHPRSLQALAERAAYWGSRVGRPAAEPLHVLRELQ
ncbi:PIG-L deacetylase family protein [Pseudonocardia halophobica]|uniref:PIG-L deacetylase family protein n=1 Tax=Pseudonocardia halophobica TaxID=29401 RepID=UPI003D8D5C02